MKSNLPVVATVLTPEEIDKAEYPALYLAARQALEKCESVDEIKHEQDHNQALAAYAKQSKNPELLMLARKILLRGERAMGVLLLEIKKGGGEGSKGKGRMAAAVAAGLCKSVASRAMLIARVSEVEFEAAVEVPTPPGRSEYALTVGGKAPGSPWSERRATLAALQGFVHFFDTHPSHTLGSSFEDERVKSEARQLIFQCGRCLQDLLVELSKPVKDD